MPQRTAVDVSFVNRINEALHAERYRPEVLDPIERFATPMMDEVLARIAVLESKSVSIAGWSTALLGFLLLQKATTVSARVMVALTAIAALVALAAAAEAARARKWKWPNTSHWFCDKLFSTPERMRAVQVLALLEAYQSAAHICDRKGFALTVAQYAILVAGVLATIAVLVGVA